MKLSMDIRWRPFFRIGLSALLGAGVVVSSITRTNFAILPDRLETTGPSLVAYHTAGAVLIGVLSAAALSAGAILQRIILPRQSKRDVGSIAYITTSMLLGSSAIAILMIGLGFATLLYREVAIGLALLLCIPLPYLLQSSSLQTAPKFLHRSQIQSNLFSVFIVGILIICCAVAVFANRGLFWGDLDGDEWEHYLHYFDLVVKSHNIWPNDVWDHFYLSKGAGLFFFAALLGDVFSVQAASMFAVVLISLIAFSLVRRATDNIVASLAAAALMIAAWNGIGGNAGMVFKHHTMIAALVLGVFWCATEGLLRTGDSAQKHFVVTGGVVAFYLGFFIPVTAAIIVAGLALMMIAILLLKPTKNNSWIPIVLGTACSLGVLIALVVNYVITGLPLDAPTSQFWPLVNRQRFSEIWSPLVVEYYLLGPESREAQPVTLYSLVLDLRWALRLLRSDYLYFLSFTSLLLFAASLLVRSYIRGFVMPFRTLESRPHHVLIMIVSFLCGTLIIGGIFYSLSVYRLYAFTLGFTVPCLVIVMWWSLTWKDGMRHVWRARVLMVIALVGCLEFLSANPERWTVVVGYLSGSLSARESIRLVQARFGTRITVDDVMDFRAQFPNERRLMMLTYDPGPAYYIPSPAMVSEPTYAFGNRYQELIFGDVEEARNVLKGKDIGYFGINLRTQLFLGVPYSSLFSEPLLEKNFGLAWARGDVFIIGWRDEGVTAPLPPKLLEVLRAKKTGDIPPDADERWGADLANHLRTFVRTNARDTDYWGWLYEEMKSKYVRTK